MRPEELINLVKYKDRKEKRLKRCLEVEEVQANEDEKEQAEM